MRRWYGTEDGHEPHGQQGAVADRDGQAASQPVQFPLRLVALLDQRRLRLPQSVVQGQCGPGGVGGADQLRRLLLHVAARVFIPVTAADQCDGEPCAYLFLAATLGRPLPEILCHGVCLANAPGVAETIVRFTECQPRRRCRTRASTLCRPVIRELSGIAPDRMAAGPLISVSDGTSRPR
ncbi:hypothetical protein [Streptomyces sp. NPDC018347]|uniref:hypothetical protein n=1 Tax=Streptomyces sp. NPDC018347 TaxID=3157193 RepID=UPI0033EA229F